MTCDRFKECVCVSNAKCITHNTKSCLIFKDKTKVLACSENRRKYYLENCEGRVIAKYQIDGGVITGHNDARCDYMFIGYPNEQNQEDIVIFVELKGARINHAYEQLESTIRNLVLAKQFPNSVKVYARIVSSDTPPKSKNPVQHEKLLNLLGRVNGDSNGCKYLLKGTTELHDDFRRMAQ